MPPGGYPVVDKTLTELYLDWQALDGVVKKRYHWRGMSTAILSLTF